jgi:hypothetical protein
MRLIALVFLIILLGFAFQWVARFVNRSVKVNSKPCPHCDQATLETENFIKATLLVNGERAPAAYIIYKCGHCKARYRESINSGTLELTQEAEIM